MGIIEISLILVCILSCGLIYFTCPLGTFFTRNSDDATTKIFNYIIYFGSIMMLWGFSTMVVSRMLLDSEIAMKVCGAGTLIFIILVNIIARLNAKRYQRKKAEEYINSVYDNPYENLDHENHYDDENKYCYHNKDLPDTFDVKDKYN